MPSNRRIPNKKARSLRCFFPGLVLCLTGLAVGAGVSPVEGQWNRLKKAAKDAADRELARQVDMAVTGMIRCALNDPACVEEARRNGQAVEITDEDGNVITDANGNPVSDTDAALATRQKPGEGAWTNYDFVPGDRALFSEDFTSGNVGDFPRRLEFLNGNMEVAEWNETKLLRATSGSAFAIPLPETLPEQFTIEVPLHWTHGNLTTRVFFDAEEGGRVAPRASGWYPHPHVVVDSRGTGITDFQGDAPESLSRAPEITQGWAVLRVMADGQHAKVYLGERRLANIPQVQLGRSDKLWITLRDASDEYPMYVGAIHVAAGGRDLYDRLSDEGRVATKGILFNTDSDEIRPESTPTLEEIGTMLVDHPDLHLAIEGHTDSQGDDTYNQDLSERRAAAVKAFIVDAYGIDAGRLEAAGLGESQPVDSNETVEGRSNNRRVELVDLRRESA
ncbi:MAG: OmpA family protein, partial [Longimicrobiales bacterium]